MRISFFTFFVDFFYRFSRFLKEILISLFQLVSVLGAPKILHTPDSNKANAVEIKSADMCGPQNQMDFVFTAEFIDFLNNTRGSGVLENALLLRCRDHACPASRHGAVQLDWEEGHRVLGR